MRQVIMAAFYCSGLQRLQAQHYPPPLCVFSTFPCVTGARISRHNLTNLQLGPFAARGPFLLPLPNMRHSSQPHPLTRSPFTPAIVTCPRGLQYCCRGGLGHKKWPTERKNGDRETLSYLCPCSSLWPESPTSSSATFSSSVHLGPEEREKGRKSSETNGLHTVLSYIS